MINSKECFKCGETKPFTAFYKHKQMKDGRVNKCKDCNKKDVRDNRSDNIEYYRAYDRARGNRQVPKYVKEYREKYPRKYRATRMIGSAVRGGRIKRLPCEVCGKENAHGHHDDYAYPLSVRWLCAAHHSEWHAKNGEGLNGKTRK